MSAKKPSKKDKPKPKKAKPAKPKKAKPAKPKKAKKLPRKGTLARKRRDAALKGWETRRARIADRTSGGILERLATALDWRFSLVPPRVGGAEHTYQLQGEPLDTATASEIIAEWYKASRVAALSTPPARYMFTVHSEDEEGGNERVNTASFASSLHTSIGQFSTAMAEYADTDRYRSASDVASITTLIEVHQWPLISHRNPNTPRFSAQKRSAPAKRSRR